MMAASNDRLRQICSHVSSTALPEGEHSCTRSRQPTAQSTAASTDSGGLSIDLSGRIALVTGATGQLGRTMVRTLARAGADLAVHYRGNRSRAESLCQEVRAIGGRAVAVYAAVDDEASVNAMRDAIVSGLGATPDIVVANAVQQCLPGDIIISLFWSTLIVHWFPLATNSGSQSVLRTRYSWTSVLEQGVEDYESQYRTCVLQNVLLAKAFCPGMTERGWCALASTARTRHGPSALLILVCCRFEYGDTAVRGRIIAISSVCAMECAPGQSAYDSGKRGMDGVLRVLAKEVGRHNITVVRHSVNPPRGRQCGFDCALTPPGTNTGSYARCASSQLCNVRIPSRLE